jgi:hypothetical protein
MRASRVVLLVVGSVLALLGMALLAGDAVLGWALTTQRDHAGYFTTSSERFRTTTAALTSRSIDLGTPGDDDWWADREIARIRIRASSAAGRSVFVGIGPDAAVAGYLAGVPHDELTDIDYSPFRATSRRENAGGRATPTPPGTKRFWVARASGPGTRTVAWDLRPGTWAVVVMNANGRGPVIVDVDVGVRVRYVVPIAIGVGVGGLVLLAIGAVLIALGARRPRGADAEPVPPTPAPTPAPAPDSQPVHVRGHLDPDLSRWQWLVKWFLAIPHFIVLFVLWIAFFVLTIVAWFAILFTGRYPRSLFDFNVGVVRWSWRVAFYATSPLGTDRYPPFTLDAVDYPATLEVEYPERLSRGLVLVKSWLLAIPHLVVVGAFVATGGFRGRGIGAGISLLGVLTFIAVVALLFRDRYPRGLFDFLLGIHRWIYRVLAYVALMTDRYPPFRLDQGPDEPVASPAAAHDRDGHG